jgi:hypothetical protein
MLFSFGGKASLMHFEGLETESNLGIFTRTSPSLQFFRKKLMKTHFWFAYYINIHKQQQQQQLMPLFIRNEACKYSSPLLFSWNDTKPTLSTSPHVSVYFLISI